MTAETWVRQMKEKVNPRLRRRARSLCGHRVSGLDEQRRRGHLADDQRRELLELERLGRRWNSALMASLVWALGTPDAGGLDQLASPRS